MRKALTCLSVLLMAVFLVTYAFAHTPICNCFDNGDGTITCEGGVF